MPTFQANVASNDQLVYWYATENAPDNNFIFLGTSFQPTTAGTYFYEVVDQATGCTSASRLSVNAEVLVGVESSVSALASTVCEGTNTTLIASGGTNYLWSTGATTPSIQAGAGTYNVTVSNADGCSNTETISVQNFPTFTAQITGTAQICEGETTTLTATSGQTYLWSNGQTSQSITVPAGNYTVEVTNANGCKGQAQAQ
ncbi:MAG: hypothetical protein HC912_08340, partial [Saprospiraceae bacterium]|nr:hypothetical protein [Saprospiraceae bacterium]